jgi:hypothetical protein
LVPASDVSVRRRPGRPSGVRQPGLQVTNDRALKTRRQQPWPEGAGGILTEGRKQPQGGLDGRGHLAQLPMDLLSDGDALVGRSQSCCLRGIRGGTQGVRAHVGNGRGLPRGSGGCRSGGRPHVTSGAATTEPSADLLGDIKLATSKGSRPLDCVPRAPILWSCRLEQAEHPPSAVRRPRRDDPPIAFAQRLPRAHFTRERTIAASARESASSSPRGCRAPRS